MQVANADEMQKEAGRFALALVRSSAGATVVALSGELGAGKTTFVQGLARALGVEEQVTSPTFVIERVYPLTGQKFDRLVHIDAYRLKDRGELSVLGWNELVKESGTLVLIEWPEMIDGALPEDAMRITISGVGEGREIIYGN